MDKWYEYAPLVLVILIFLWQNRVFVTPEQMTHKFVKFEEHLEEKFVLQKAYDVAIKKLEESYEAIDNKLEKIYDLLIKG